MTHSLPPRPNMIPEQLRQAIIDRGGEQPRTLNRHQSLEFAVSLAANLERLLNDQQALPWITASIDKHANGFSLHVTLLDPIERNDIQIVDA